MKKSLLLAAGMIAFAASAQSTEETPESNNIRVEVSTSTGTLSRTDGKTGSWKDKWEYSGTPSLKILVTASPNNNNRFDMTNDNGELKIANGNQTATYSFTCDAAYYVSRIEFDAIITSGNASQLTTFNIAGTSVTTSHTETKHIAGDFEFHPSDKAIFTITGDNVLNKCTNFYVTLTKTPSNITIKNASGRYMTAETPNGHSIKCWSGNAGLRAVWTTEVQNGKTIFTNAATGRKLNGTGLDDNEGALYTVTPTAEGASTVYIIDENGNKLSGPNGLTTTTESSNDCIWTIAAVTDDQLQLWHNEISPKLTNSNYHPGLTFGNRPGQYVPYDNVDGETYNDIANSIANYNAADEAGYYDYPAAMKIYSAPTIAAPTLFDPNSTGNPALITMEYTAATNWGGRNKVIASNLGSSQQLATSATADVFLLTGGTLYGLNNGRALKFSSTAPYIHTGDNLSDNVAERITFGRVTSYNGCYSIKCAANSKNFGGSSTDGYHISLGATNAVPGDNYRYTVQYVDELSVDIAGNKLYRTPVAVSVEANDAIETYVISIEGSSITTTKVDPSANTVYAAGTGFIFHGNGTQRLIVHNGEAGEATYAAAIGGSHAICDYTPAEGKIALVIAPAANTEISTLSETVPSVTMVATGNRNALAPHSATIELTKHDQIAAGTIVNVALGSTTPTGIDEIEIDKTNATDAIFDLQGRRLSAPVKGINIINGRKVLVK